MTGLFGKVNHTGGFLLDDLSNEPGIVLRSPDNLFVAAVHGELFLPSGELLTAKNFTAGFALPFLKESDSFLTRCEGSFVCALYDGSARELHLVTDPFGNLALHYHVKNDAITFSTEGAQLATACGCTERDERAELEYLALGHALSGKTWYKNVVRLDVASHLRFGPAGLSLSRYFAPSFATRPKGEYEDIQRSIHDLVLHNIEIRTRGETPVRSGLSGGFDSRVMLAALVCLGRRETTLFTLGTPESGDIRIARVLAAMVGFPHEVFEFDADFWSNVPAQWEEAVVRSEGGMDIESSPQLLAWKSTAGKGVRHFDGHGGSVYRRQILKATIHQARRYPSVAAFAFEKLQSPLMRSNILEEHVRIAAKRHTMEILEEYFATLPDSLSAGDKIDRYCIEQRWAHHYGLGGNLEMQFTGLSHPMLSPQIWELLSQLDDGYRATNAVLRWMIHAMCPVLETVPLDNSGFRVPYSGYEWLRYIPNGYERFVVKNVAKYSPAMGRKLSIQRMPFDPSMVAACAPQALRELALRSSNKFDHFFNRSAIASLHATDPMMMTVANAKVLLGSLTNERRTGRLLNALLEEKKREREL